MPTQTGNISTELLAKLEILNCHNDNIHEKE
jgi:hypothetical protein